LYFSLGLSECGRIAVESDRDVSFDSHFSGVISDKDLLTQSNGIRFRSLKEDNVSFAMTIKRIWECEQDGE
jgi:hypothetical protein